MDRIIIEVQRKDLLKPVFDYVIKEARRAASEGLTEFRMFVDIPLGHEYWELVNMVEARTNLRMADTRLGGREFICNGPKSKSWATKVRIV